MRHQTWMERDERTPDQVAADRLRFLKHEEQTLMKRLEHVQAEMAKIPAKPSNPQ